MRALPFIFFIFILVALEAPSFAGGDEALNELRDTALSFFTPMAGNVVGVVNGTDLLTDIREQEGIKPGMRLTVKREGAVFTHPITKEPLGRIESPVGTAEVVEAGPEGSRLLLLEGEARAKDIVRGSAAEVPALYYQTKDVDWYVAEEYFWRLKDTGRFELLEAAFIADGDQAIASAARKLDAEIAIILSVTEVKLVQRLIWAADAKEFSLREADIDEEFKNRLRLGEELFTPPGEKK